MPNKKLNHKQCGLTLIELLIVITVIGIVSSVASIKYGSSSQLTISQQTQMFAGHIRQMRALSINWGCNLKMIVVSSGYSVTANKDYTGTEKSALCKNGTEFIQTPGRFDAFNFKLNHGVTFSGTGTLYLDNKGQPSDATMLAITTNVDFQITENGNYFRIRVFPVTGFIEISKL